MLRKRILAAATATILALGFAVGGASPAMAAPGGSDAGTPCNSLGYTKPAELDNLPDDSSGEETYEWGTVSWDSPDVTVTVNDGYVVDFCVKGGNTLPTTSGDLTGPTVWEYTHTFGLSHMGFTFDVVEEPGLATASIDLTDPTCELGETLNEDGFEYSNASVEVVDNGSEDGTYEVVFTADEGYEFEGGLTELVFEGELQGPDTSLCQEPGVATASIDLTDPTCELGETLNEDGFEYSNASVEVVDNGSEDGTYEVVFTADEGYEFEGGLTELVFEGELQGPDTSLCEEPQLVTAAVDTVPTNCVDGEGVIAFLGDEGVTYTVDGIEGTFESGDSLENLDAGEYTVRATAPEGSEIDGESVFEVEVEFEFIDCLPTEGTASVAFDWTAPTCDLPGSVTLNTELTSNATEFDPQFDTAAAASTVTFHFIADEDATFSESEPPVLVPASGEGAPTIVDWEISGEGRFLMVEIEVPAQLTGPDCDLVTKPLTEASVTWKQADCLGNPGSYTLTNEPGVVWTVDGVTVAGNTTYTAAVGSTPTIVAALADPDEFGFTPGQQTEWNLSFTAAENCLPTLAITGASNAISGLATLAFLVMMVGTGLVVARRREAVRVQG